MTVSHWQIDPEPQEYDADFLVIGAGLTGCSAAIFAAAAGRQVTITDARGLGLGASSRNAGFLLSGIDAYYHLACERYGAATVRELWALSRRTHAHWRGWGEGRARIAETGTLLLAETPAEARDIELAARALDAAGIEHNTTRVTPSRGAISPPSSATRMPPSSPWNCCNPSSRRAARRSSRTTRYMASRRSRLVASSY